MCGASLASPPPAEAKPAPKEVANGRNGGNGDGESVHGPSFLGLADDPKVEFHYLYEDEQPRSHAGLIFFLVLLVAAGGFGYWQYRHNGYPFNRLNIGGNSSTASASPSEVAPAQSQEQQTHIDKPMTGVGDVLPTAPDQKAQGQNGTNAEGSAAQTPAPGSNAAAGSNQPANTGQANANQEPAARPENQQNAAAENSPEKPEKTEQAKATPPPVAAKPRSPRVSREPKPAPKPTAAASPDADLEATGERYLYGNGVPQNCARATSSLQTAAARGNSKAQTVLGTMYATGHCVGRDLPTAYRWFARALRQEPQNSRISDDLQVLWRQMSPQEKQLATAAGR